jgi:hypothetical protein
MKSYQRSPKLNPFIPALAITDESSDVTFNIRHELHLHKNPLTADNNNVDIGIYIVGDGEKLGNWNPDQARRLVSTKMVCVRELVTSETNRKYFYLQGISTLEPYLEASQSTEA